MFRNALNFVSNLRLWSVINENVPVEMPSMPQNAVTSSLFVNKVVKERYVSFWQALRQFDYRRYIRQMVERSKGAPCRCSFNCMQIAPKEESPRLRF